MSAHSRQLTPMIAWKQRWPLRKAVLFNCVPAALLLLVSVVFVWPGWVNHSCTFLRSSDAATALWPQGEGSLLDGNTKVRLCALGRTFVTGTYIFGTDSAYAQLTVFEAEVLPAVRPPLGESEPEKAEHLDSSNSGRAVISFLAFLEDEDVIASGQWGWGGAPLNGRANDLHLSCEFRSDSSELLHQAPAQVYHRQFYLQVQCPLPLEGLALTRKASAGPAALEVSLVATQGDLLHLEKLPLCVTGKEGALLSKGSIAVCSKPFHLSPWFETRPGASYERYLEWLNYHLMIGVDTVYFYDRWGSETRRVLQPYIDRGRVVHVPFPGFSEVFYRKQFYGNGKAQVPKAFPEVYDQLIVYEHCLMQGRRNGQRWLFMTDHDEALKYRASEPGHLPAVLAGLEASFLATSGRQALPQQLLLPRFNFMGLTTAASVTHQVFDALMERCSNENVEKEWVEDPKAEGGGFFREKWHGKAAVVPGEVVGHRGALHSDADSEESRTIRQGSEPELYIHHYTTFALDYNVTDVCEGGEVVVDRSMGWAVEALKACQKTWGEAGYAACKPRESAACEVLCRVV